MPQATYNADHIQLRTPSVMVPFASDLLVGLWVLREAVTAILSAHDSLASRSEHSSLLPNEWISESLLTRSYHWDTARFFNVAGIQRKLLADSILLSREEPVQYKKLGTSLESVKETRQGSLEHEGSEAQTKSHCIKIEWLLIIQRPVNRTDAHKPLRQLCVEPANERQKTKTADKEADKHSGESLPIAPDP